MSWRSKIFCALGVLVLLSGCSPIYLAKTAGQQIVILSRRKPIAEVVKDDKVPQDVRAKLALVTEAREFAPQIGLQAGDAYTTYSQYDGQALAWVLVAARREHFELKTWWFPIVGSIPYKGFVSKEDAEAAGQALERDGYEVWVRPTVAYSTLGWFNDPVVTPMLGGPEVSLVNTILHELTHRAVWIQGSVAFNETLANFVGTEGAKDYYRSVLAACLRSSTSSAACTREKVKFLQATSDEQFEYAFADALSKLYLALDALYKSDRSTDEKLALRNTIFTEHVEAFRKQYPTLRALQKLNNAELIQLYLYRTHLEQFRRLFQASDERWEPFWAAIRKIQEDSQTEEPYQALEKLLSSPSPRRR